MRRTNTSRTASERWGRAAEEQTAARYADAGGRILDRRVRTPAGEVDLVVAMGDVLVFVEVKARRTLEAALQSVRPAQRRRLTAAAEYLVADRASQYGDRDIRFDLAAVGAEGRIEIIENAFVEGLA